MTNSNMKSALQDLIYRLQDAEKGYNELYKATSNPAFHKWLKTYTLERHKMHQQLEKIVTELGGSAEVDTTFLGKLHRMFIDIKISNTSLENQFEAIIDEIERGATSLISDYQRVLQDVEFPSKYVTILMDQKTQIQNELKGMKVLRELEKQSLVL
jgi:uncharacterized protein (TIGR02284 family)